MSVKQKSRRVVRNSGSPNEIVLVRVTVEIPEKAYDTYAEQAMTRGLDVEHLMADRLTRCKTQVHDSLVFTADQKKRLDHAVGHTTSDAEGALQRLENQMRLKVQDVDVTLEPRLIARIESRAKAMRQDFAVCLKREVIAALRRFTGLDPA